MIKFVFTPLGSVIAEFSSFCQFFFSYLKKKIIVVSNFFEKNKNTLVKLFTIKRGRYNRPFMHLAAMGVLGVGVMLSPFLAETYPVFSQNKNNTLQIGSPALRDSIIVGANVFQTDISDKPRSEVLEYTVKPGDTLSSIANAHGISVETIRWANDLVNDNISINDTLKILPVTGIYYKVVKGDTVYSIAKKLDTDPQKIVDFTFNDFANPETFALVEGQMLMVPDGIKPTDRPAIKRQAFIASAGTFSALGFTWPAHGIVSQFATWYHMALDIASSNGTPIVAARDGAVIAIEGFGWNGGYGVNVVVDHGGGYSTLYAHLESVNVKIGEGVTGGQSVLGWIGMTGRTTGPHVHFEIRKDGVLLNPLPYLQ